MDFRIVFSKNGVLFGLILSVVFLCIAGFNYPGGSPINLNSIGYSWTENYISNLMEYKALNGLDNEFRLFAVVGVVLMGLTSGLAFVRFAPKVGIKKYSIVIKYLGLLLIVLSCLITIPSQHDLMVTLSSIVTLLLFFYVTILFVKSKLLFFKLLSIVFMIVFYGASFMYFTKTGLDYLPLVQKTIHIFEIVWILGFEYFTVSEDFEHIKS